jgi:hypothetical protein
MSFIRNDTKFVTTYLKFKFKFKLQLNYKAGLPIVKGGIFDEFVTSPFFSGFEPQKKLSTTMSAEFFSGQLLVLIKLLLSFLQAKPS